MTTSSKSRFKALLFSALLAFSALALAGCGGDETDPPNAEAEPQEEQPMGQGPMSNDDAGETPSDEL